MLPFEHTGFWVSQVLLGLHISETHGTFLERFAIVCLCYIHCYVICTKLYIHCYVIYTLVLTCSVLSTVNNYQFNWFLILSWIVKSINKMKWNVSSSRGQLTCLTGLGCWFCRSYWPNRRGKHCLYIKNYSRLKNKTYCFCCISMEYNKMHVSVDV